MAHITFLCLSLFLLVLVHRSYQWNFGGCPRKRYIQGYKYFMSQWPGTWYEYARKGAPIFESFSRCNRFDFGTNLQDNSYSMISPLVQVYAPLEVKNEAKDIEENFNAHFTWSFKLPFYTSKREVHILFVDFNAAALVWNCEEYLFWNYQTTWVLVRDAKLQMKGYTVQAIQKALEDAHLDFQDFTKVSHEDC